MQKKVGVVLVNYNGEKYITDCINSLLVQTYTAVRILIWDNHSSDGSVSLIKKKYPEIELVESSCNYGFAKANNLAVKKLLRQGADYILLLNTDTAADPFLIEKLLKKADENTVTTAHIHMGKHGEKIWYAGGMLKFETGSAEHFTSGNCKDAKQVSFISGCCMMIHRDIIRKHGLFDTNYFLYYEDTDLCMRWYLEGVRMYYVPDAVLWHKVGGSHGKSGNFWKKYYMVCNRLYFVNKFHNDMQISVVRVIWNIIKEDIIFAREKDLTIIVAVCKGIADFTLKYLRTNAINKERKKL